MKNNNQWTLASYIRGTFYPPSVQWILTLTHCLRVNFRFALRLCHGHWNRLITRSQRLCNILFKGGAPFAECFHSTASFCSPAFAVIPPAVVVVPSPGASVLLSLFAACLLCSPCLNSLSFPPSHPRLRRYQQDT